MITALFAMNAAEIVIFSHSSFLLSLFNGVLTCDNEELKRAFVTGEVRSTILRRKENHPMFSIGAPFVLGVNYWPRKSAMRMWKDFDLEEIQDDFQRMQELGLKV